MIKRPPDSQDTATLIERLIVAMRKTGRYSFILVFLSLKSMQLIRVIQWGFEANSWMAVLGCSGAGEGMKRVERDYRRRGPGYESDTAQGQWVFY